MQIWFKVKWDHKILYLSQIMVLKKLQLQFNDKKVDNAMYLLENKRR